MCYPNSPKTLKHSSSLQQVLVLMDGLRSPAAPREMGTLQVTCALVVSLLWAVFPSFHFVLHRSLVLLQRAEGVFSCGYTEPRFPLSAVFPLFKRKSRKWLPVSEIKTGVWQRAHNDGVRWG